MVEKVPSLKGGGLFWFTDLTTPDPLYILPVLTGLSFLATVEVCSLSRAIMVLVCTSIIVHVLGVPLLLSCMLSVVWFRVRFIPFCLRKHVTLSNCAFICKTYKGKQTPYDCIQLTTTMLSWHFFLTDYPEFRIADCEFETFTVLDVLFANNIAV